MSRAGGCLCGGVRCLPHGEPGPLAPCHCSQCRKARGGSAVAVAPVRVYAPSPGCP
ncbi:MAG TPA: hypothetical protein PKC23_01565 [Candidatus Desulfobacillus sp.]|nr:hypothetical protein [Candidatus Desulfobacillus sp.]